MWELVCDLHFVCSLRSCLRVWVVWTVKVNQDGDHVDTLQQWYWGEYALHVWEPKHDSSLHIVRWTPARCRATFVFICSRWKRRKERVWMWPWSDRGGTNGGNTLALPGILPWLFSIKRPGKLCAQFIMLWGQNMCRSSHVQTRLSHRHNNSLA